MKRNVKRHVPTQPQDQSIKLIPLTKGQNAIVDAVDFEWLSQWNWSAYWNKCTKSFYAQRGLPPQLWMHSFILGCKKGEEGDHKNHDTLDNRRENLRKATRSENARNMRISTNTSGYRGVCWHQNRWVAMIKIHQKPIYLGRFRSKEDAARAYDAAAKIHHGEFATLNFP